MRKKFCPLIFSRVRMAAKTMAKKKVIMVTVTISRMVFCMEVINFTSLNSTLKLFSPTKVSVGE